MVNGKTPYLLTLTAAVLFGGGLLALQPYSVTSAWNAYTKPARRFLSAAARQDTIVLHQQSLGATAVQWALAAARYQPDTLLHWARYAYAWAGTRRGDTAEVFVQVPNSRCDVILQFVGPVKGAKVKRASSGCFERR